MVGSGMAGLACPPNDTVTGTAAPDCLIDLPCEDDPAKTCEVNVCGGNAAGIGQGTGTGAGGGATTGGSGGGVVDVTGSIVALTSATFDESVAYGGPITVIAEGAGVSYVEAATLNGTFALAGAAAGLRWVLAKDGDGGAGGAFSTYSLQDLDGVTSLVLPVISVDVLEDVATDLMVPSLTAGSAHLVMRVEDENGFALDGVELAGLAGATVGYDLAPGQYGSDGTTGGLGIAVALNVQVAARGTVSVTMTFEGVDYLVPLAIAPDTVTYGLVTLETTP